MTLKREVVARLPATERQQLVEERLAIVSPPKVLVLLLLPFGFFVVVQWSE